MEFSNDHAQQFVDALKGIEGKTEELNKLIDVSSGTIHGMIGQMPTEESKAIMIDINQTVNRIKQMAKSGDFQGVIKAQTELYERQKKYVKPEQKA